LRSPQRAQDKSINAWTEEVLKQALETIQQTLILPEN
jgi:hypothetical protein